MGAESQMAGTQEAKRKAGTKSDAAGRSERVSPADAVSEGSLKMRFAKASWNTGKTS